MRKLGTLYCWLSQVVGKPVEVTSETPPVTDEMMVSQGLDFCPFVDSTVCTTVCSTTDSTVCSTTDSTVCSTTDPTVDLTAHSSMDSTMVETSPVSKSPAAEGAKVQSCSVCSKGVGQLFACSRCHSGLYCSKGCQKEEWENHKVWCSAITTLEGEARQKRFDAVKYSSYSSSTPKEEMVLIKLVGNKCNCSFVVFRF